MPLLTARTQDVYKRQAYMDGVDLVTEGVLTLNRVLQLLRRYVKNETVSEDFFEELDKPNGGSMVEMCIRDSLSAILYALPVKK